MKNPGYSEKCSRFTLDGIEYWQYVARWWALDDGSRTPLVHMVTSPLFKDKNTPQAVMAYRTFCELVRQNLLNFPIYSGDWKDGRWS